jgi:hypothetical protein
MLQADKPRTGAEAASPKGLIGRYGWWLESFLDQRANKQNSLPNLPLFTVEEGPLFDWKLRRPKNNRLLESYGVPQRFNLLSLCLSCKIRTAGV